MQIDPRAAANAQQSAADASTAASAATAAQSSASSAATSASNAQASASSAATSASNAEADAARASNAASDALNQLSIIEDVSGTLSWISEHGSYVLTTDTTVHEGTVYFEKQGSDYVPITNPTGNPRAQGWYVLDITDSQSEYIMTHLAVTSAGLWVLPSGMGGSANPATASGYKLLLGSSGMVIYDATGTSVASYGTSATIGREDASHTTISDEDTVFYDADGNEAGKISMSSEGAVPTSATYTITTSSTGTVSDTITGITPLPDFTLGYLVLRGKVDSANGSLARFESWSDVASPVTMSTSTIDYTFKATPNVDSWSIEITATNRSGYTAPQTVTYTLEWYYSGSAPQYKFGTGENAGAYSFLAGMGLKTAKPAQIVLGSYNEPSQTDLLIVGNGTSDENRSNVLSIDENNTLVVNSFSQRYGGVTLTQSALWGWEQALGLSVETIYETSVITIKRFGRMIMVQCHGVSGTANNNVPLANVDMSAYKPSYNASTIVCDTQSTAHFARLWVSKDDGKPYLAFAGYSGASTWYGTLTYIY